MANKKIPLRQCTGCREMKPAREMIRVIKLAAGGDDHPVFELDATGRKNGRGAYICRNTVCLAAAVKNKGLERSFKMPVPGEIYEILKKEMEEFETG